MVKDAFAKEIAGNTSAGVPKIVLVDADGKILISLASDSVAAAIKTQTDKLGDATIGLANIKALIDAVDDYVDTEVAAVKAKTDFILPGTKVVTKTSTSPLTTGTIFTWAGSVQILSIIGRVTTVIQSQATTVKLGIQADALTTADICATKDINAFLAGSLLSISGTYTDALVATTGVPTNPVSQLPIVATCITSGIITVTYGAASSGAIVWEVLWMPLNSTGSVVAA
jgi:hypothetical protein